MVTVVMCAYGSLQLLAAICSKAMEAMSAAAAARAAREMVRQWINEHAHSIHSAETRVSVAGPSQESVDLHGVAREAGRLRLAGPGGV